MVIIDTIFDWLFAGLTWLVGRLPSVSFDCSGLSGVAQYLGWVGGYVNLSLLGSVLGFIVATEVLIWSIELVVWIYNKIPMT